MSGTDGRESPLAIAVLLDSPDENWPSMDLVGEMLLEEWAAASERVLPTPVTIGIPSIVRRLPVASSRPRRAWNADRALARYVGYPARAALSRRGSQFFHVVDHSYAHLVHVLPHARTGVYCHDLDVVAPMLHAGPRRRWSSWRVLLARTIAAGLQSAAVVFHNSLAVGSALREHGLVEPSRLVHAPLGVAREFHPREDPLDTAERRLSPLVGRPFLLHVGSEIPRKRLDVVFEVFAALRAKRPDLHLVQLGATLSPAQRAHIDALGIRDHVVQPPRVDRSTLAGLYRRAAAVLVASEAEGFGLPVIEALACGSLVVASDIPVLREVGAGAAVYAPVGDVPAWTALVGSVLETPAIAPARATRLAQAARFTWARHAQILLEAYRGLAQRAPG